MNTVVAVDTREHSGKKDHILRVFDRFGVKYVRTKLYVGDWTLLLNQSVCVDTKTVGLQEVYNNLVQDHERFRDECIRAKDVGIRLIVLVEEPRIHSIEEVPTWVNQRDIIYRKQLEQGKAKQKAAPISSQRLYNIMKTMSELYAVEWMFADHEHCGEVILQLLGVNLF